MDKKVKQFNALYIEIVEQLKRGIVRADYLNRQARNMGLQDSNRFSCYSRDEHEKLELSLMDSQIPKSLVVPYMFNEYGALVGSNSFDKISIQTEKRTEKDIVSNNISIDQQNRVLHYKTSPVYDLAERKGTGVGKINLYGTITDQFDDMDFVLENRERVLKTVVNINQGIIDIADKTSIYLPDDLIY